VENFNYRSTMDIDGPSGALEARYDDAPGPAGAQAVLCHPHPRYGGSLHDAVLDCLTDALLEAGIGVLRFNFRGVGGSAGRYDDGRGEADDLLAAACWLRSAHPGDALWLGGYSFGAWVAWQALDLGLQPDRVLLVAPPVGRLTFRPHEPEVPVDVVIGDADAFADPAALAAWSGVITHTVAGADHFFTGCMDALARQFRGIIG
jgi:hypothetical protein